MNRTLFAAAITGALCFSSMAFAKGTSTTIQIIMDDSGVLIEPATAYEYRITLLGHMKQLTRKRELANAHIDVISTSLGRTIWSGTPSDLKRKPERALKLVESIKANPSNCNNLPGSFVELESNLTSLKRRKFNTAHVVVFSSLIHTPRPCTTNTSIVLPQMPPAQGNINSTLSSSSMVRSLNFYWVSPHQKRVWEEFLKPTFDWALMKGVNMTFMDIERSKFSLEKGLELEVSK
ncbi:MAG: hypothetical protein JMN24_02630 [gamma proteobacterium endosymbiont of Lamellibrachia anaximandri]|nr:hypothetical protein [gamma proteobacterium endosymbiont of Lamellibrachia anaximandri]MBL3619464.1 hypothetical protein [gamma proteobacterium endosymbiont of Lamellibrachia anaximandri]